MRYRTKHSYSWSANLAYATGLIASDGCLQKDARHLDLTSIDLENINNFSVALGRELKITRKSNGRDQYAHRVQFSDVALYDFFLEAGLTPAKSMTLGEISVPDEYYADFLRGYFDGDGSTYSYLDNRWRSSYMFYTCFTSASPRFVEYLRRENIRLAKVSPGSIRNGKNVQNLSYAKADSKVIYSYMYYSPEVLCLKRKREKLRSFIERDEGVIISQRSIC
jgi:hypothetical protein